jgi:D-alanine-D-alanine ligase
MKIIVICGGNSSEKEVSLNSGMAVFSSVKKKYDAKILLLDNDYKILKNHLSHGDIVFNALHGGYGESGELQSFLESQKINFTGSGSRACSIAIDKKECKKVVTRLGVKSPPNKDIDTFSENFTTPFIVKPNKEGSSVGFFIINNKKEMLRATKINKGRDVIFEDYIRGRELTVSILNDKVLPIVEIIPKNGIYDYESKYSLGKTCYSTPAKIDLDIEIFLKKKSLEIFNTIGCSDYARIDYILSEENVPYFLEINTSPGMTETSLFPKSANQAGLSFDNLVEEIVGLQNKN